MPLEFVTDSRTNERYVVPAGTRCELVSEKQQESWSAETVQQRDKKAAKDGVEPEQFVVVLLGRRQRLLRCTQVE